MDSSTTLYDCLLCKYCSAQRIGQSRSLLRLLYVPMNLNRSCLMFIDVGYPNIDWVICLALMIGACYGCFGEAPLRGSIPIVVVIVRGSNYLVELPWVELLGYTWWNDKRHVWICSTKLKNGRFRWYAMSAELDVCPSLVRACQFACSAAQSQGGSTTDV